MSHFFIALKQLKNTIICSVIWTHFTIIFTKSCCCRTDAFQCPLGQIYSGLNQEWGLNDESVQIRIVASEKIRFVKVRKGTPFHSRHKIVSSSICNYGTYITIPRDSDPKSSLPLKRLGNIYHFKIESRESPGGALLTNERGLILDRSWVPCRALSEKS